MSKLDMPLDSLIKKPTKKQTVGTQKTKNTGKGATKAITKGNTKKLAKVSPRTAGTATRGGAVGRGRGGKAGKVTNGQVNNTRGINKTRGVNNTRGRGGIRNKVLTTTLKTDNRQTQKNSSVRGRTSPAIASLTKVKKKKASSKSKFFER